MNVVRTEDFCIEIATKTNFDHRIILEIVGGIANLYLSEAIRSNGVFETETTGFIFSAVPKNVLISEIQNCSGFSKEISEHILSMMHEVLADLFIRNGFIQTSNWIFIEALGKFKVRNIEDLSFQLRYMDPALPSYPDFLLS